MNSFVTDLIMTAHLGYKKAICLFAFNNVECKYCKKKLLLVIFIILLCRMKFPGDGNGRCKKAGDSNIMKNQITVGERIKILRTAQNRTLQEVADGCELSKSMISKIENNKTMPSIATLVRIATVLGTSISALLEEEVSDRTINTTRQESIERLVKTEKGYWVFPFASAFYGKKMQPFLFVARKGEVIPHQLSHEGEEFIFIVEGCLKMQVGDMEYILHSGDSLYFNALHKHGILPVSDEVTYIDIFV